MLRDRLIRGALAGAIASAWWLGWNLFSYYVLHLAKVRWIDALSQLVMNHPIRSLGDWIVSVSLMLLFNGMLGVVYTRFVVPERDGGYVPRAIGLALGAWFVLQSIGTLYKIPFINVVAWQTAISNWIAVSGWGVITGWLVGRWDSLAVELGDERRVIRVVRRGRRPTGILGFSPPARDRR